MEVLRVVVLSSRPVVRDTVNELTENQILLLKNTPGWPGPFYKCSRQDPEAAYSCRSV
jgi:hypothetical protein